MPQALQPMEGEVYLSPDVLEKLERRAARRSKRERVRARVDAEARMRKRLRARAAYARMKRGPYLEPNGLGGQWVYIPSDWYSEEARAFWNEIGCRFLEAEKAWVRPVNRPYEGEQYSACQWLRSIRRTFFELHADELAEARHAFSSGAVYVGREAAS